jgi:hypothetical protein
MSVKVLDLFAGSRSFSKIAQQMGMETFTSDINAFDGIDYVTDILEFDVNKLPWKPDIIWASPPCTCFSVASIGRNWALPDRTPKTPGALQAITIVQKTVDIIKQLDPHFFFIENPRGMLRTLPVLSHIPFLQTVTYCQYGDTRMKPTDIWTNSTQWLPRPACNNGDPCHTAAPRGSATGTQGLKNAYERSKVPDALCIEILQSCIKYPFPPK